MSWEKARDFLLAELSEGTTLPAEYDVQFTSGPRQGQVYRVIVLTPDRVATLSRIRKHGRMDEQTINFAPTGACACCGR